MNYTMLRFHTVLVLVYSLVLFHYNPGPAKAQTDPTEPVNNPPILPDDPSDEKPPDVNPPDNEWPADDDEPGEDPPDPEAGFTKPPAYIQTLTERTGATEEQVFQFREAGYGWGNIKIAFSLAGRMAEQSDGDLSFDEALQEVAALRSAGQGWGTIGKAKNVKVGDLVKSPEEQEPEGPYDGEDPEPSEPEDLSQGEGFAAGMEKHTPKTTGQVRENKSRGRGFFTRLLRRDATEKGSTEKPERPAKPQRIEKPEKPERPGRMEKPERPARPEKPEKPQKPEKPGRAEKPEKPERPGRGLGR